MSTNPTTKPPGAGSGGEGTTTQQVHSTGGWNHLIHNLSYHVPTDLRNARKARRALRILMTKGR